MTVDPAGALVVPIRSFARAKGRLSSALDDTAREVLARTLAERLLAAADGLRVVVATEDAEVAAWALAHRAVVCHTDGLDLSASVTAGIEAAAAFGAPAIVVAHADLADPDPVAPLLTRLRSADLVLVPDRHGDGTNLVALRPELVLDDPTRFSFAYGPGSFRRHLAGASGAGLRVVTVTDVPGWAWDIDHPADLDLPEGLRPLGHA